MMAMDLEGKPVNASHRYYTRSSTGPDSPTQQRHSFDERRLHRPTLSKQPQLPSKQPHPPADLPTRSESDGDTIMQDCDPTQTDSAMMDTVAFSASAAIRAPFPSPAMKSTQPFFALSPQQTGPYGPSEAGWGHQEPWQQGGVPTGTCILVEAANRAQMAILVDDMGCMAIEQTDS
jgi:hypothetical protein